MTIPHPRIILPKDGEKTLGSSVFWEEFRRRAAARKSRLLFPEATDGRVLSAVSFLARTGIAEPVLVGDPAVVRRAAEEGGVALDGIEVLPLSAEEKARYADTLHEKRQSKGLTGDAARALLDDSLYFACMLLKEGRADGLVAGAVRTTADTVRAGFACLGTAPGTAIAFGLFVMECPAAAGGPRRILFADGAVSPHPSPRALAAVGIRAAAFAESFLGEPPRVAFLSFSTRGSAEDESVSAVREAAASARAKAPGLAVDGELQGDAALIPDIARQKGAGDSEVSGRANVLVAPDLNAGNIAYKLVQHLGGARAVGPLLVGLAKPVTDLSRGCTDEDIVDAAALLSLTIEP